MRLIAGIDPGTTVGWAVLNLKGGVVSIGSGKGIDLDSLIARILKLGRVILVGTDKAKFPSFVQDVAVKLGAKVVGPSDDVRVDEKRSLTSEFAFGNDHEMDALASALLAHRKIKTLLSRIHAFLEREKRLGFFDEVVELVLKEEISMRAALLLLLPKEEKKEPDIIEEKRDEDIVHLYSALSRARRDNSVLLEKNRAFEKRFSLLTQELNDLKYRVSTLVRPKTHAEIARVKESQISSLSSRLSNSLRLNERLKSQINFLEKSLFDNNIVPVVRLSRLSWDEVFLNKDFIGSVVFVDDCNQMSEKAVKFLQSKNVQILICLKMPSKAAKAHLPFACVPAPDCRIANRVALVDKVWLENTRSSQVVLSQIVEEYKKQRLSK